MTRLRTIPLAIIAVASIFGGIGLASLLGYWNTESTKQPATIREGEFSGLPSPSDIRGSYSWNDIEKAFGVPAKRIMEAFGTTNPDERVSALETLMAGKLPEGLEIGTDSVRLFVALYAGLPHEPESGTMLPAAAIPILRAEGKAGASRIDEAASKVFDAGAGAAAAPAAAPAPAAGTATAPSAAPTAAAAPAAAPAPAAAAPAADHETVVGSITGKTTFADLAGWGFDMRKVEDILGGTGPSSQAIKDYCAAKGLSFSDLKAGLQALAP